jgi:hypothetical protein
MDEGSSLVQPLNLKVYEPLPHQANQKMRNQRGRPEQREVDPDERCGGNATIIRRCRIWKVHGSGFVPII